MSEQIFCLARDPAHAKGLVAKIASMGIPPKNIAVAARSSDVENAEHPDSRILHDAKAGLIIGGVSGWFVSATILAMIGTPSLTIFRPLLLLMGGGVGGAVLGAVLAATGVFGMARLSARSERRYEAEVGQGGILIAVEVQNRAEQEGVMTAIKSFGAADVHYSSEIGA